MQAQIIMFPPPYHESVQYHFYARCGCCVLFQNSSALVSSVQKKNVTNTTLECQCCPFAKFSHAVMFSSSIFLSWCPTINTLLVQYFTYCGLITTMLATFSEAFANQQIFCYHSSCALGVILTGQPPIVVTVSKFLHL